MSFPSRIGFKNGTPTCRLIRYWAAASGEDVVFLDQYPFCLYSPEDRAAYGQICPIPQGQVERAGRDLVKYMLSRLSEKHSIQPRLVVCPGTRTSRALKSIGSFSGTAELVTTDRAARRFARGFPTAEAALDLQVTKVALILRKFSKSKTTTTLPEESELFRANVVPRAATWQRVEYLHSDLEKDNISIAEDLIELRRRFVNGGRRTAVPSSSRGTTS
ncbi:hypothetical protein A4X09_0g1736 [Tilletia walkeri]|uniref:Uncharacterized protein n=1 Tax=Tilletia walkeri TaxID=117179 RepID=A0A8X7NDM9_9BASI|nr:hypothetical protein A4X09_0g1736 [Tilletia walkeri]